MTENEKPKPDYLKWWLIILTVVSGLIWLPPSAAMLLYFPVVVARGFSINNFLSMLFIIGTTPLMVFFSWRHWWREKRGLAIIFSAIQILISTILLVLYFSSYLYAKARLGM